MLEPDLGKLNVQLLGDQHRHRCVGALSHFHLRHNQGHGSAAINSDEGIRRKCAHRSITSSQSRVKLSSKPPPAAAPAFKKARRETPFCKGLAKTLGSKRANALISISTSPASVWLSRLLDGGANTRISSAPTYVAAHGVIDSSIVGLRITRQKGGCRHDLTGLAIPALHHFKVQPGVLNLLASWRIPDRLNRRDCRAPDALDGGYA